MCKFFVLFNEKVKEKTFFSCIFQKKAVPLHRFSEKLTNSDEEPRWWNR